VTFCRLLFSKHKLKREKREYNKAHAFVHNTACLALAVQNSQLFRFQLHNFVFMFVFTRLAWKTNLPCCWATWALRALWVHKAGRYALQNRIERAEPSRTLQVRSAVWRADRWCRAPPKFRSHVTPPSFSSNITVWMASSRFSTSVVNTTTKRKRKRSYYPTNAYFDFQARSANPMRLLPTSKPTSRETMIQVSQKDFIASGNLFCT
jgi:hypothetical protein